MRLLTLISLLALLLLPEESLRAFETQHSEHRVITAARFDRSPPLHILAAGETTQDAGRPFTILERSSLGAPLRTTRSIEVNDAVVQSAPGSFPPSALIATNFDGLSNLDNETVIGGRVAPAAPDIAVSDQYIVQVVHLALAVYDKGGDVLFGPVENSALFAGFGGDCEDTNSGYPIVLYDEDADRWVVSHMSWPDGIPGAGIECVAISHSGDPTDAWYRYQFDIGGFAVNDAPKLGVGDDAYYSSYNMFSPSFLGAVAAAFERDAMIAGDPGAQLILFGPEPDWYSLMPYDIDGGDPAGNVPGYFVEIETLSLADVISVYAMVVDWESPGSSTFSQVDALSIAPFDADLCPAFREQCIPQPNGEFLEGNTDRVMQRLQFREFSDHYSMVFNHTVDADGNGTAGIRWYELRDEGKDGTWTVHQQGTYAPDDGLFRWTGSIAMDAEGNMALGYTASSSEQAPSIRYTARRASDPLGHITYPEEVIVSGVSHMGTARWGEYSAMETDASSLWYTHQYGDGTGSFNWATRIAQIVIEDPIFRDRFQHTPP
jgi:hypothetical protein